LSPISRKLFRDDEDPVGVFVANVEEFTLKWVGGQHQEHLASAPVKLPPVTYLPSVEPVELPGGGIPGLSTPSREQNRESSRRIQAEKDRNKPSPEEIARHQAEVDARTLRNIALVNALNEDWAAKQALQQALQQTKEVTP
jgi:hypothetical protein